MTLLELYDIADQNNITVDCFEMERREAFSLIDGDECYIAIDPFRLRTNADEKTKLAHELGHCMTGSFYNRYAAVECRQRHENHADKWAIRKLIPQKDLDNAIADGITEIWELAEHFGVSEDFVKKAVCLYTYGNLAAELYF